MYRRGGGSQVDVIEQFFNRTTGEKLLKLRKYVPIQLQEAQWTPKDKTEGKSLCRITLKNSKHRT